MFPGIPTCVEVSQEVTDYLEGDLPAWRRALTRMHLLGCSACRELVRQFTLVKGAVAGVPPAADDALAQDTRQDLLAHFAGGAPDEPDP